MCGFRFANVLQATSPLSLLQGVLRCILQVYLVRLVANRIDRRGKRLRLLRDAFFGAPHRLLGAPLPHPISMSFWAPRAHCRRRPRPPPRHSGAPSDARTRTRSRSTAPPHAVHTIPRIGHKYRLVSCLSVSSGHTGSAESKNSIGKLPAGAKPGTTAPNFLERSLASWAIIKTGERD